MPITIIAFKAIHSTVMNLWYRAMHCKGTARDVVIVMMRVTDGVTFILHQSHSHSRDDLTSARRYLLPA